MAGGTIWKGTISFGATHLPVKLRPAVREERVRFHLLHGSDRTKLQQQMFCSHENIAVLPEAQTRGFQVAEGKFVIVAPEEVEQATPESSRVIEVHEFVPAPAIDPIYWERTYYLEPDTLESGYHELAETLQEMALTGICTWTMRKRAYFGALQGRDRMLRLSTLRHADEIVSTAALGLEKVTVSERELQIGRDLVMQLTATFQPERFTNEHEQKLQLLLDKKARGEKIVLLRPKVLRPTTADDLLSALEASLKKVA